MREIGILNREFYCSYELVHERYDPFERYTVNQVFNILKYQDQLMFFNEFCFDINWYYDSLIRWRQKQISIDEDSLAVAKVRREIIELEEQIYKFERQIPWLQESRKFWLQKLLGMQVENEKLLLKIYDFCLTNHRQEEHSRFQKGLRNFFKGKVSRSFR